MPSYTDYYWHRGLTKDLGLGQPMWLLRAVAVIPANPIPAIVGSVAPLRNGGLFGGSDYPEPTDAAWSRPREVYADIVDLCAQRRFPSLDNDTRRIIQSTDLLVPTIRIREETKLEIGVGGALPGVPQVPNLGAGLESASIRQVDFTLQEGARRHFIPRGPLSHWATHVEKGHLSPNGQTAQDYRAYVGRNTIICSAITARQYSLSYTLDRAVKGSFETTVSAVGEGAARVEVKLSRTSNMSLSLTCTCGADVQLLIGIEAVRLSKARVL